MIPGSIRARGVVAVETGREEAGWGEQLYFSKVNENATVEALRNYLVASGYQIIHEQAEDGWMTVAG